MTLVDQQEMGTARTLTCSITIAKLLETHGSLPLEEQMNKLWYI